MKCDESKPTCLRCARAQRVCGGYRPDAPGQTGQHRGKLLTQHRADEPIGGLFSGDLSARNDFQRLTLLPALSTSPSTTWEEFRLSRTTCTIFANDPQREANDLHPLLWSSYLPQCINAIPLVSAAAAAFAASFEATVLKTSSDPVQTLAVKTYHNAIRLLRQDLQDMPYGNGPLVLACLLLGSADVLHRNFLGATAHLQGAHRLLLPATTLPDSSTKASEINHNGGLRKRDVSAGAPSKDVLRLFLDLDLQVAQYSEGRPPDLPCAIPDPAAYQVPDFTNIEEACFNFLELTHSCYHFTVAAAKKKYKAFNFSTNKMALDQCRYLAHLHTFLQILERNFLSHSAALDNKLSQIERRKALILKARCLSTIIHVTEILNPYETRYDKHGPLLISILTCAREVLSTHRVKSDTISSNYDDRGLPHFSVTPGIIQPLFLVACKYRHSRFRREALSLLRSAGIESPWNGRFEARVAQRLMEIEEYFVRANNQIINPLSPMEEPYDILPGDIVEKYRICDCTLIDRRTGLDGKTTDITLSVARCVDLDSIVSGEKRPDDPSCWITWQEQLPFDVGMDDAEHDISTPSSNTQNSGNVEELWRLRYLDELAFSDANRRSPNSYPGFTNGIRKALLDVEGSRDPQSGTVQLGSLSSVLGFDHTDLSG